MALITLAQAKSAIKMPSTETAYDTRLQQMIDAALPLVEDVAGVCVQRTVTAETYDGGSHMIVLRQTPVASITSVIEYVGMSQFTLTAQPLGSTVNNYGYELIDATRGLLLRRGAAGDAQPFLGGTRGVIVSYTAGPASVPANVVEASMRLVAHWWQGTQQGGRPQLNAAAVDDMPWASSGYALPNAVVELLVATPGSPRRIPGIA